MLSSEDSLPGVASRCLRDPGTNLWRLSDGRPLPYPNDSFAATGLEPILRAARDLTSLSPELEGLAGQWPASYYLSARRTSLLRGFEWSAGAKVLEIGAGCGTITRFLGETFDDVLALEGEPQRARMAQLRTRDLLSVQVLNAAYGDVVFERRFDLIFCIGVLEYAALFESGPDPFHALARACRDRLSPEGTLVLAIENQFGLKYLSGAAEDHSGIAFDSVEGYHRSGTRAARTFSRAALERLLADAGFRSLEFHFPFPDYKFASSIITDAAARQRSVALAGLIGHQAARDHPPSRRPLLFDQRLAWHEVIDAGLVPDLANSFLVFASPAEGAPARRSWDAVSFSIGSRAPEFWTRATLRGLGTDHATVERRALLDTVRSSGSTEYRLVTPYAEPWHDRATLGTEVARAMQAPDCDVRRLARALAPWVSFLRAHADGRGRLDGGYFDALPGNLVPTTSEGDLRFFDRELARDGDVALELVLARGLYSLLVPAAETPQAIVPLRGRRYWVLMRDIAHELGEPLTVMDMLRFIRFEHRLQETVAARANAGLPRWLIEVYCQRLPVQDRVRHWRSRLGRLRRRLGARRHDRTP